MEIKGINYDVGTEFIPGDSSRTLWTTADVQRDLRVIRRELGCTHVNLYGTDLARLSEGAAIAFGEGLAVSLQPRLIDGNRREMLAFLARGADEAERLRTRGPVTLNTGCELTLFTAGFMPGRTFLARLRNLRWAWPLLPWFNARLRQHLRGVVRVARERFGGPITYAAGSWESVDWSGFDLVGVNLYRDRHNLASYVTDLRRLRDHGRPVVITEFGCSAFTGADLLGGGGWLIVDRRQEPPAIEPGHTRDEDVQARYLGELLDLFAVEGVHGAYVFDFMESSHRHDPDPRRDLDMAGYGIVKVLPHQPGETTLRWERKRAFAKVARRFNAPRNYSSPSGTSR